MSIKRRVLLASIVTTTSMSVIPKEWVKPLIQAVILPAHGMTSCSGFNVEPIDQPISITIIGDEVRGPIVATLNPDGSFDTSQTLATGVCVGDQDSTQEVDFSGTINSLTSEINGQLNIKQFCGVDLVCDQVSSYSVTQVVIDPSSDLGDYEGRIVGTISCCQDFA